MIVKLVAESREPRLVRGQVGGKPAAVAEVLQHVAKVLGVPVDVDLRRMKRKGVCVDVCVCACGRVCACVYANFRGSANEKRKER